ncbi:MAG: hypothetical protein AAGA54_36630 [Myxococcota bacterium]
MTQPTTTLKSILLTFGAALLTTACTVTLDPDALGGGGTGGDDDDAQCLELFETCVELAGDSPGCNAVFEYCAGPGGGGDDGDPEPGCEEDYINCLAEGVDPDACEPLLWDCGGGGGDDGDGGGDDGCDPDNPDCGPIDPTCDEDECGGDCGNLLELCIAVGGGEDYCSGDLLYACEEGDCDTMLNACAEFGIDEATCVAVTGCYDDPTDPPGDDCDELLNACYEEFGEDEACYELYPDCFEPVDPTGSDSCEWYYGECYGQFTDQLCNDAAGACEAGILPEVFECGVIFPDYCGAVGLSDTACVQAEEACWNGFFGTDLCASLSDDPFNWLHQIAECNGWE